MGSAYNINTIYTAFRSSASPIKNVSDEYRPPAGYLSIDVTSMIHRTLPGTCRCNNRPTRTGWTPGATLFSIMNSVPLIYSWTKSITRPRRIYRLFIYVPKSRDLTWCTIILPLALGYYWRSCLAWPGCIAISSRWRRIRGPRASE